MNDSRCHQFADLTDRAALGEALSEPDFRFVQRHGAECTACAAEVKVWDELCGMMSAESLQFLHHAPPAQRRRAQDAGTQPVRRFTGAKLAIRGALFAAAALALWVYGGRGVHNEAIKPPSAQILTAPKPAVTVRSVSGTVYSEGSRVTAGMTLSPQSTIEVGDRGRVCLDYAPGIVACAGPNSVLQPHGADDSSLEPRREQTAAIQRELRLEQGTVVCELDPRLAGGGFSVSTPRGRVTARGTVFAVELPGPSDPAGLPGASQRAALAVRLHRGSVAVRSVQGKQRALVAPAALTVTDDFHPVEASGIEWEEDLELLQGNQEQPAPSERKPRAKSEGPKSASRGERDAPRQAGRAAKEPRARAQAAHRSKQPGVKLQQAPQALAPADAARAGLERAATLRAAGRFSDAAAAYATVVSKHRGSAAARAALLSLAELQLSHLRQPARALRSFEAYLAQGGPLAQEAQYGRIRALRQLGRTEAAHAATGRFLRDYPGSAQAEALEAASKP